MFAIQLTKRCFPGVLLAKSDIGSVFRLFPIPPPFFNSLAFFFDRPYYFDRCLPMGALCPVLILSLFPFFLQWVVFYESGFDHVIHYLDDFLFLSPADSPLCLNLLKLFCSISENLMGSVGL